MEGFRLACEHLPEEFLLGGLVGTGRYSIEGVKSGSEVDTMTELVLGGLGVCSWGPCHRNATRHLGLSSRGNGLLEEHYSHQRRGERHVRGKP